MFQAGRRNVGATVGLGKLSICTVLLLLCAGPSTGQTGGGKGKENPTAPVRQDDTGRFRVTLTGLTVNRQTDDNVLETDGKGDEVFVLAEVAQYDRYTQDGPLAGVATRLDYTNNLHGGGNVTLRRSLVSVLIGDVNNQNNPPRIQAGSASSRGGLRTGDRFPTNEPWIMRGEPTTDRPPMLLWEGELRRDRDLVIIVPTVWEWDGGNVALRQQFTEDIDSYFSYITRTNQNRGYVWRSDGRGHLRRGRPSGRHVRSGSRYLGPAGLNPQPRYCAARGDLLAEPDRHGRRRTALHCEERKLLALPEDRTPLTSVVCSHRQLLQLIPTR